MGRLTPINYSDPFGLCPDSLSKSERACEERGKEEAARRQAEHDDRTTLQVVGDFAAGFGDFITFGGTKWVRDAIGCGDCVDFDSGVYTAGQVTGAVTGAALGGLTAARAAGVTSRVAIHGAHHTFPVVGRAAHIQVNVWQIGVKGSGSALRVPLPWR